MTNTTGFSFNVLGFLSKAEKQKISEFILMLDERVNEKFSGEKQAELVQIVADTKKIYIK